MPPVVLLVEDHADARGMYTLFLTTNGCEVIEAENGAQALKLLAERLPDVIVTDLGMPGMDGFEFCRRVREMPHAARVPILAVTGQALPGVREVAGAGFCGVCTKPFPPDELLAFVRGFLADRPNCLACWNGTRALKPTTFGGRESWLRHDLADEPHDHDQE